MFPTERFKTPPFEARRSKANRNLTGFRNLSGLSTPLDAPLLLFLLTAVLGVWTAHDSRAAWFKLVLIAGGLLLFYTISLQPAPRSGKNAHWWLISGVLAALAPLTAGYFLLTQFDLPLPQFHPNVMAGIMAMLLPYTLAFAWRTYDLELAWRAICLLPSVICLLPTGVALLLTGSRGAILGLLTTFCLWILWRLRKRFLLLATAAVIVLAGLAMGPAGLMARFTSISGTLAHRLELFRQTLYLITDFPFTGAGLGSFPGLYSEYILNIPYFMLPSSHNLLLDVALEQGILGLLAFGALLLGTLWLLLRLPAENARRSRPESTLRWAATASVVILLIHGLIDDPIYSSKALPLLFIAPGIAVSLHRAHPPLHLFQATSSGSRFRSAFPALAVLITGLGLTLALLFSQPWQAKWFSNLGAVEMARVQLAEWPAGAWSDGSEAAFLGAADAHFHRSLSLDPQNATARHRLGLIAMMHRDYPTAVTHLSIAHAAVPGHEGIRKALGYSHLWAGQPDEALEYLHGLSGIRSEMRVYNGWWRRRDRQDLAELAHTMLVLLEQLPPADET